MKILIIILGLFIALNSFGQSFNIGLSTDFSTPLVGGKERAILLQNSNQLFPMDEDKLSPSTLWYTYGVYVDAYYGDNLKVIASLGLRTFSYGWNVDTVSRTYYSGSINPPTGNYVTVYGSQENLYGYYLPTVGVGLEVPLSRSVSLLNKVSFGYLSFVQKRRIESTAFVDSEQGAIDELDGGFKKTHHSTYLRKDAFDLKISSCASYNLQNLSIYGGLSYYYFGSSSIKYGGLHLDIGVSYKFL